MPLTSNFDALFSLLKCVLGTGILAMPLAYMYGGIIGGTVMTTLCVALLIYGMHLLIMCMVEASKRNKVGYMNFPETMEFAFAEGPACTRFFSKASGYLVDLILGLSHYGVNVVYIVFVAVNVKQFLEEYDVTLDLRIIIAIVGVCCLPLFMLRQLKYLVPGNVIATFLILGGLLSIFWYFLRGLDSIGKRNMFGEIISIPFFMGIVMFATSSVGVMLAIEGKMEKPAEYIGWFGVLNVGSIFIIVLNVLFGFVGYWRYGDEVLASVTLNIPSSEVLAQMIKLALALAVFLTYPLSGYVPIDIIMNHYVLKKEQKHPIMIEYVTRFLFVLLTTINAIAFPNLGPLLALVGAFSISLLNLIFPCFIEICLLHGDSYGKLKWKLWKDILIIIFGTIVLVYGSFNAIKDIIIEYGGSGNDD
ncbi:hypothetical protein KR222_008358 [Zaprionus bogoriensis]|nr:hypothetical protein KR222_008358 [Zaprionus bogoriensis]